MAQFRHAMADNFDLIQAEIARCARAQTNLLSAVVDYITSTYQLRAAIGTLVEKPETF